MKIPTSTETTNWAEHEFGLAQLIDNRLNKRLAKIASDFYQQPTASIPQVSGSAAQAQRTYDFFKNPFIDVEQIHHSHSVRTIERCSQHKTVLVPNDTSYLDFTSQPAKKGMGSLASKNSSGMLLHPSLAVSTDGVPLGITDIQVWSRPKEDFGKSAHRQNRPIDEKESQKWLNSYLNVACIQAEHPDINFVSISDRESDVFDLFELIQADDVPTTPDGRRPHLLIRAAQDRRVLDDDDRISRVWKTMEQQPLAGTYQIEVPRTEKQKARTATLEVRFKKLTILPPKNQSAPNRQPITLWAIWAFEKNPPNDCEQLSWMLLTSIEINSVQDAIEKIHWYKLRWLIEWLFKILKSGCQFEKRQLDTAERLQKCLLIDLVVAWRILYMIKIGRQLPNLPATTLFEEDEWKALYMYVNKTTALPQKIPTLHEGILLVAILGGFLNRKSDGEPGTTVLWRGLHRLCDITQSYRLFFANPESQGKLSRKD
jgi:hypothetical protein